MKTSSEIPLRISKNRLTRVLCLTSAFLLLSSCAKKEGPVVPTEFVLQSHLGEIPEYFITYRDYIVNNPTPTGGSVEINFLEKTAQQAIIEIDLLITKIEGVDDPMIEIENLRKYYSELGQHYNVLFVIFQYQGKIDRGYIQLAGQAKQASLRNFLISAGFTSYMNQPSLLDEALQLTEIHQREWAGYHHDNERMFSISLKDILISDFYWTNFIADASGAISGNQLKTLMDNLQLHYSDIGERFGKEKEVRAFLTEIQALTDKHHRNEPPLYYHPTLDSTVLTETNLRKNGQLSFKISTTDQGGVRSEIEFEVQLNEPDNPSLNFSTVGVDSWKASDLQFFKTSEGTDYKIGFAIEFLMKDGTKRSFVVTALSVGNPLDYNSSVINQDVVRAYSPSEIAMVELIQEGDFSFTEERLPPGVFFALIIESVFSDIPPSQFLEYLARTEYHSQVIYINHESPVTLYKFVEGRMQPIEGSSYSTGRKMLFPGLIVVDPNQITARGVVHSIFGLLPQNNRQEVYFMVEEGLYVCLNDVTLVVEQSPEAIGQQRFPLSRTVVYAGSLPINMAKNPLRPLGSLEKTLDYPGEVISRWIGSVKFKEPGFLYGLDPTAPASRYVFKQAKFLDLFGKLASDPIGFLKASKLIAQLQTDALIAGSLVNHVRTGQLAGPPFNKDTDRAPNRISPTSLCPGLEVVPIVVPNQ